jgi:hypothetical protein
MDGKFHLFDSIVKVISSVYETPHKMQGVDIGIFCSGAIYCAIPRARLEKNRAINRAATAGAGMGDVAQCCTGL